MRPVHRATRARDAEAPRFPQINAAVAKRDTLVGIGACGEVQVGPSALVEQVTDQIIDVQTLHDDHDGILRLVVKAAHQRVGIPAFHPLADALRVCVLGLHWVIDNNKTAAATGERAADGRCESAAPSGGNRLKLGIFL